MLLYFLDFVFNIFALYGSPNLYSVLFYPTVHRPSLFLNTVLHAIVLFLLENKFQASKQN